MSAVKPGSPTERNKLQLNADKRVSTATHHFAKTLQTIPSCCKYSLKHVHAASQAPPYPFKGPQALAVYCNNSLCKSNSLYTFIRSSYNITSMSYWINNKQLQLLWIKEGHRQRSDCLSISCLMLYNDIHFEASYVPRAYKRISNSKSTKNKKTSRHPILAE